MGSLGRWMYYRTKTLLVSEAEQHGEMDGHEDRASVRPQRVGPGLISLPAQRLKKGQSTLENYTRGHRSIEGTRARCKPLQGGSDSGLIVITATGSSPRRDSPRGRGKGREGEEMHGFPPPADRLFAATQSGHAPSQRRSLGELLPTQGISAHRRGGSRNPLTGGLHPAGHLETDAASPPGLQRTA